MSLIGYVKFEKAHITKHHGSDRLGNHYISYLLRLTKDEFEACREDGLPAKYIEKTGAYFINITPIIKDRPMATIPEESAFVGRNDIDCTFDVFECTFGDRVFRKLYLRAEGIEKHVKQKHSIIIPKSEGR